MLKVDLTGIHVAGTAKTIATDMVELLRFIRKHADEIGEDDAALITLTVRDFAEMSLQSFPYYEQHKGTIQLSSNEESLKIAAEMLGWEKQGGSKSQLG